MSFYDNELQEELNKNSISYSLSKITPDEYFQRLNHNFPVFGTQIDWTDTSLCYKKLKNETLFIDFNECVDFIELTYLKDINSEIIYIGDSLTEYTYLFDFKIIKTFFSVLATNVPQHHYFTDLEGNWCIAVNMENDFNFGYSRFRQSILKK